MNIFISHNSKLPFLLDFEKFIKLIGLNPIIVENLPDKKGWSSEDKIEHYLGISEYVIFLFTKDTQENERYRPKDNILLEFEKAQRKFSKDKLIYAMEEGVTLPSMKDTPAYISLDRERILSFINRLLEEFKARGIRKTVEEQIDNFDYNKVKNNDEYFFVAEYLANKLYRWCYKDEMFGAYNKKFNKDMSQFNIFESKVKKTGLAAISTDKTNNIYWLLTDNGLIFLEKSREERAQAALAVFSSLVKGRFMKPYNT